MYQHLYLSQGMYKFNFMVQVVSISPCNCSPCFCYFAWPKYHSSRWSNIIFSLAIHFYGTWILLMTFFFQHLVPVIELPLGRQFCYVCSKCKQTADKLPWADNALLASHWENSSSSVVREWGPKKSEREGVLKSQVCLPRQKPDFFLSNSFKQRNMDGTSG